MRAPLRLPLLLGALALGGCQNMHLPAWLTASPAAPAAGAGFTYTVGGPYEAGGVWYYPREQVSYVGTGLAIRLDRRPGRTADGETWDPTALLGAHPTLPLPAIVRVTNLETGLSLLVRLDDRGPGDPHRLIGLTPRAATLLGAGSAPFRVRVELQEAASRALAGGQADTGHLKVDTAPVASIASEDLAPPPGARASTRFHAPLPGAAATAEAPAAPAPEVPLRLPEQVTRFPADPGRLYIELARFSTPPVAVEMAARYSSLGATASADYAAASEPPFRVRIGPLQDTATADATLDRALRLGVSDARIVVNDD
jgi:rare lipoprotein A